MNAYLAPKGQRWINENDTYNCEVFGGQIEDRKISRCFKQSLGARVISIGSLQLRDMDTDMDRVTWTWTQTNMDRVTWTWTQETSDLHILYICGCFWAKFCVCLMFRTFRDVLFVGLTSRFPTCKLLICLFSDIPKRIEIRPNRLSLNRTVADSIFS